ncbi:M24 family metallopeptidase [Microvirga antarctica]|uniref:M24 family metallopeptidase n=1 Tax=Microvirga antarctica TaxID=2819233 RepID=UPI001B3018CF|nr:Xaa-Pro peptidase family protein [Microvirga antarctica]
MPLTEVRYRGTIENLRRDIQALDVDAVLLLDTHNVVYASGFFHSPNERPIGLLVPVNGPPRLLVPLLEKEHAEDNWVGHVQTYDEFPGTEHPVLWMIRTSGYRRIAVDTLETRLFMAASELVDSLVLTDCVERLRYIKTDAELALVRAAARYADMVLEAILHESGNIIRRGGTEIDILAAGLTHAQAAMKRELGPAFGPTKCGLVGTVHTGVRASLPHGKTLPRTPVFGEPMIAGIGASVGGYHAESGVTFAIGGITDDQRPCFEAAIACDAAGRAALVPGASCQGVNEAALQPIRRAGLSSFLRHRIGHGMGVQGHEAPWLAPGDDTPVQVGMVFSNEPGIYRPGLDGYRTISTMIVGSDGVEVPSRFQAEHPLEKRVISL